VKHIEVGGIFRGWLRGAQPTAEAPPRDLRTSERDRIEDATPDELWHDIASPELANLSCLVRECRESTAMGKCDRALKLRLPDSFDRLGEEDERIAAGTPEGAQLIEPATGAKLFLCEKNRGVVLVSRLENRASAIDVPR
jgi:hypothetical protein